MPNGWGACISFSVYRSDCIWRRWTRSANSRRLRRILPTARIMSLALIICVTIWCMKRARAWGAGCTLRLSMNALPPLLKRQIGEEKADGSGVEVPGDYTLDEKARQVFLTESGHEKAE